MGLIMHAVYCRLVRALQCLEEFRMGRDHHKNFNFSYKIPDSPCMPGMITSPPPRVSVDDRDWLRECI